MALFTKDNGQWKIDSGYWTMGVYDQKPKENKRKILSLLSVIDKNKRVGSLLQFYYKKKLTTNKQFNTERRPLIETLMMDIKGQIILNGNVKNSSSLRNRTSRAFGCASVKIQALRHYCERAPQKLSQLTKRPAQRP